MKPTLLVLIAAITACARITGTPAQLLRGKWGLRQEGGHALPVLYQAYGGDTSFVVAETLWFDGKDSYSETLYIESPKFSARGRETYPGNYQTHGDEVVLYQWMADVPPMPTSSGVRIAGTLVLAANRDTPAEVYGR